MKIVYLTNGKIDSKAAYAVNIASMCNAFSELGHNVTLLVPSYLHEDFINRDYVEEFAIRFPFNIKTVHVSKRPLLKTIQFLINGISEVKKMNPDLLFTRFWYDYLVLSIFKGNTIIERHIPFERNSFLKVVQKKLYIRSNLKAIVVITDVLKKMMIDKQPELKSKIIVLSDGANIPSYNSNEKIHYHGKCSVNIGYFGHLYEGRGIEIIISLARLNVDFGFHIFGGNDKDIDKWKTVSSDLNNLFFYGHLPHSKLGDYAIKMDILLAPYQLEVSVSGGGNTVSWMSPLKIFEYMSYKIPFICSDIPVLTEVLQHGQNCLLVEPGNILAWNYSIHQLLINFDLKNKIAQTAFNDFCTKYTWKKRASQILLTLDDSHA